MSRWSGYRTPSPGKRDCRGAGWLTGWAAILTIVLASSCIAFGACEDSGDEELRPLTIQEPPGPFEFCPTDHETNLVNALWAAYFSANAYAHYYHLGPAVGELGFGAPVDHTVEGPSGELMDVSEGQAWQECAEAVMWMRDAESGRSLPADFELWPYHCARKWWAYHVESGGSVPAGYAAAFEKWLLQTVRLDAGIQFFYEGRLSDDQERFIRGSTQVVWLEHRTEPVVMVAFRGTEPSKWADIVTDLDVLKEPFDPDDSRWGEVHSGFLEGFQSVLPQLEARARHLLESGSSSRVWITGHSLGGALATVMTAWILEKMEKEPTWADFPLAGLVTFGSPRVGNEEFVDRFDSAIDIQVVGHMRFVHGNDIVTRIPVVGYEHVGDTYYLGKKDDDECPTDSPCFVIRSGDTGGAYLGSIDDHDVASYYQRILAQYELPANAGFLICH